MPRSPHPLRWTRASTLLLSAFLLVILLIIYVWWPLAEQALAYVDWHGPWWRYLDWLLIGIFLFMSFTIVAAADLKRDAVIIFVATLGGLVIEAWGTQTNLWFYYTQERPPLWIVPAWPIATLSIDRLTRLLNWLLDQAAGRLQVSGRPPRFTIPHFRFALLYWLVFTTFLVIMIPFVAPTFSKPSSVLASLLCVLVIATPNDHRRAVLVFAAGAGLGYFLELWGTTRACWTYYTYQTPPLFAVLAHGMAAVIFWRTGLLLQIIARRAIDIPKRRIPQADQVNTDLPG